jgi:hypothetical protein
MTDLFSQVPCPGQVVSRSDLFKGDIVDAPKPASAIIDLPDGDRAITCPGCGKQVLESDCDDIGAEPDCVFCCECGQEILR